MSRHGPLRAILACTLVLATVPALAQADNPFVEEIEADDLDTPLGDGLDEPVKPKKPTPKPTTGKPRDATAGGATAPKARPPADRADDEAEDGGEDAEGEEETELAAGIEIIELSYDGVLERWFHRRKAYAGADPAARTRADSAFEEGLRNYGVQGISGALQAVDFAAALVEESRRAVENGDAGTAVDRAAMATRTAPDLPPAYSQLAWAKLSAGDIGGTLNATIQWGKAVARDPSSSILGLAGLLAAAVLAVLAVLLLFAAVGLSRAFQYLTFDLHNALPRGAARWQVRLLVVLLAALPLVVNAGPVFTVLWWVSMSWLYFDRREQIVVAVLTALLLPAPYAIDAVARLWSFPGSRLADAYAASYDLGALKALERIERVPEASRSLRERAAIASRAKREGQLEEAYQKWRLIVQEQGDAAWAHNNVAVVAALLGKEEHAKAAFESAKERDPRAVEPLFNLSLIYTRAGKATASSKQIDQATALSPERVEAMRTLTFRRRDQSVTQNRAFVDMAPPYDAIPDALAQRSEAADALAREVAGVAFYGQRGGVALGMMAAFLVLWGLLWRVRQRLLPSHACVRCGSAASRRYDADEVPPQMCSACYHTFLNPNSHVEAGMKLRKERQVNAYRRGRRRWLLVFTVLWPGLGHLYGGAPLRGAAFALVFAYVLAAAALAWGPLPWPHLEGSLPLYFGGGVIGVVLLFLYPLALRSAGNVED